MFEKSSSKNSSPRAPYIDLRQSVGLIKSLCAEGLNPDGFSNAEFLALLAIVQGRVSGKLATLGYFGLIDRLSKGTYCLSEDTKTLINDTADSKAVLRHMFLRPEVFSHLHSYFADRVDLFTLTQYLKNDYFPAFHENTARKVAKNYLASRSYACMREKDIQSEPKSVKMQSGWQVIAGGVFDITDPSSAFEVRIRGDINDDRLARVISRLDEMKTSTG